MKIFDLIALSARNLSRRKGRTALTVIGVAVGTCLIIVMISFGIAMNQANEAMLASWGDLTQIEVYGGGTVYYSSGSGTAVIGGSSGGGGDQPAVLNDEMVASFTKMDHVVAATPFYQAYSLNGTITAGKGDRYSAYLGNAVGVYASAMEPMGFTLASGDWMTDTGSYGRDVIPVMVCEQTGYNFEDTRKSYNSSKRYRWYGQTDAAGNLLEPFVDVNKDEMTLTLSSGDAENPKTKSWKLKVVGSINPDTAKGWWTQSSFILRIQDVKMLQEEYKDLAGSDAYYGSDSSSYDQVYVKVDDMDNVEAVDEAIQELGFSTYSMTQQREAMQEQVSQLMLILGCLAAFSLLVAALNIINTMTMAIYERTREIGVMKVLGCALGKIRMMFLIESGFIGFIGGVTGSVVSLVISFVLNNLTLIMAIFGGGGGNLSGIMNSIGYYGGGMGSAVSVVPPWLVLLALAFATVIGLVAGILPAARATKISALEAIRHE
ncbi:ABC transporter permease [Subdoligranulum sp. DSM 109015]|uniref:ABC transporter permease n=1 Tax=Gemmiger gallinarum TaxID=2779354 RepID=A0ABR9R6E0_9FIRM|nr:ABC transporter permease [Gemmiger gallinarum]MBE5038720.1 ABC transporter permease [Gemmiger gallinarum]